MDVLLLLLPLWLQMAQWEGVGSASAGNGILSTLPPLQSIWAQLAVLECTRYHANPAPREARHATASQIKHTHNAQTSTLKPQVLPWPNPARESWHWSIPTQTLSGGTLQNINPKKQKQNVIPYF